MGVGVYGCIHVVAIDTPSPTEVLYPQREERTIPEMFLLGTSLCPKVGSNNEKAHIEYDGSHFVTSSAHGTRHLPNLIKSCQMPFMAYRLNYMPANIFHYTDWETSISPRLLKDTCCACELINDCYTVCTCPGTVSVC